MAQVSRKTELDTLFFQTPQRARFLRRSGPTTAQTLTVAAAKRAMSSAGRRAEVSDSAPSILSSDRQIFAIDAHSNSALACARAQSRDSLTPMVANCRPRKPSKKPQYALAFSLYCDGVDWPEIARKTGLPQELVERCAAQQNWANKRGKLAGSESIAALETRLQAQNVVDSTLVRASQESAETLAQAYVRLIGEASALPTEPYADAEAAKLTEQERYRHHCTMIERKAGLMRIATSGLRELIETAQNVGLLKVERGGKPSDGSDDRDKPIDLSKLTQLNIAIVQATSGNGPAKVLAQIATPASDDLRNVEPIPVDAKMAG